MAKKRIANYVFLPGKATSSYVYPNAYSLFEANVGFIKKEAVAFIQNSITSDTAVNYKPSGVSLLTLNKTFLQDEITAWIANQVSTNTIPFVGYTYDAAKCKRDVGYIIDAYIYDLRYGGNEKTIEVVSQYWISGIPQVDGDRSPEVAAHQKLRDIINNNIFTRTTYTTQQSPITSTQNTTGLGYNAEADCTTKITAQANLVASTILSGLSVLPSLPTAVYPNAVKLLKNNKSFLKDEITAWIAKQVQQNTAPFIGYTYDAAKCKRDVGYIIDAYIYDIKYGGNEKTREVIQLYWANGVAQVDGSRAPEVAAHTQLANIINNYVFQCISYPTDQTAVVYQQDTSTAVAEAGTTSRIITLSGIVTGVIQNGLSSLPALSGGARSLSVRNFAQYIYDTSKCERDIGYVLTAYLNDFRYGGNVEIRRISSRYWDGGVPQVDGDREPEVLTHEFIQTLINGVVLTNATYSPLQNTTPRQIDGSITSEPAAFGRITELVGILTAVIAGGLPALPAISPGCTTIKVQGKIRLDEILLITNTTNNQILYTFGDPTLGAVVNYDAGYFSNGNFNDEDFPRFLQVTGEVTTIKINADTTGCSINDEIQIFVESAELIVRPYNFGTDAIERMRIAAPQSMLDADFEYGLQPTKWQAIGVARGYPSVYEIPGSDTAVLSVTTDASAGTAGIGQSLITVTTNGAHGFSVGTPVTIKGYANTISGFSRAEGTFLVNTVPSNNTFTYYAIAKVGTSNGQILATTYSQLRKGAFYTGASIGVPVFSVFSNGIASSFTSQFITAQGSDQIAYTGTLPQLGAPVTATGINPGTQVTGTVGPGGLVGSFAIENNVTAGSTSIVLTDSTGILEGMAIDDGSGTAIFVNSIAGNTVSFTGSTTINRIGNTQLFENVSGTYVNQTGSGAIFSITRTGGNYSGIAITNSGGNYRSNSRITIIGTDLGGTSPANDLVITITTVDGSGGITGTSFEGTSVSGDAVYSNLVYDNSTGQGSLVYNAVIPTGTSGTGFNATFNVTRGASYSAVPAAGGQNYAVNDTITISGADVGGATPANDATLTVTQVTKTYTGIIQDATSGTGSAAVFDITRTGATYTATVATGGSNYAINDTVTIFGTQLGGTSPANDLIIQVTSTNGGQIDTINVASGTATGPGTITTVSAAGTSIQPTAGSAALFTVNRTAGAYTPSLSAAGAAYNVGDTLRFNGTQLGGTTPANNLVITITVIGLTGDIVDFTFAGTAVSGDFTFTNQSGTLIPYAGAAATFDVTRSNGTYPTVVPNLEGTGYRANEQLRILGTSLSGASPANDVIITIDTVGVTGNILTASATGTSITGVAVTFYSAITISEPTIASIPNGTSISTSAIAVIQITFSSAHGLVPGANMLIDITSAGSNHALAKGPFYVESTPDLNVVRYTARSSGVIDTTSTLTGIVYARPDSFFVHRPFDGGVQLGTGGPQHGVQAIRMSKKYIRYQSGKGIMYTTGALFAPSYNIQTLTADGTAVNSTITLVTDDVDHGCQVGGKIRIVGVTTAGYNGEYVVADVVTERILKVRATTVLGNLYAFLSTAAQMSVLNWHGSTVRAGTFDDQNGMFWQYDGKYLAVGRRSSTFQLTGFVSIVKDTNLVVGTNSRFRDQVKAGDRVVIRGMTHIVTNVTSDSSMTVTPDYRGATNAIQAKMCLVQDLIARQYEFNLDTLDGNGPSGYDLDISKMQMIGMQWSWYGAGFIDFMLRGADGNYVFAHRIRNSNTNTEAYMRTGNMPVRYEVINEGATGKLANSVTASQTTLTLVDASNFPDESGVVLIENELISFNGKSYNTLIGCTRSAPLVNFVGGAQRTFRAGAAATHEYNTGVVLVSNTISPIISHWGSAMLTDGRFDEDRGYLFNYASTGIQASTTKATAFLIRLAPSVSNAIIGDLGDRELINRAQLLLKAIEVTTDTAATGGVVVEGVLNPSNYPTDPGNITWSGLAGSSAGGQPSFAQIAPGGSVSWAGGGTTTTATGTTTAALVGTASVPNNALFAVASGSSIVYVTKTSWDTLGATAGMSVSASETKFPSGTTINTITPNPNPIAVTLSQLDGTAVVPNNAGFNRPLGTNFFYVTQASWQTLGSVGIGTRVNDAKFPANTVVSNVVGPQSGGGFTYFTITVNQPSLAAINANATVQFSVGGTANSSSTTLLFTQASWTGLPIGSNIVGNTVNDTGKFNAGTTIQSVSSLLNFNGIGYYSVTFNSGALVSIAGGTSVTLTNTNYYTLVMSRASTAPVGANATISLTPAIVATNTSFLYLTQASWENLVNTYGATIGTELQDPNFPSGAKVSSIGLLSTFASIPFYRINFTQSSTSAIGNAATITFRFGLPPYAQPGETIFSFVAAPGSSANLNLGELKELTNTTLGGRGTYPNGPDVLAINVYRATGTGNLNTNIVLRWGEAQA